MSSNLLIENKNESSFPKKGRSLTLKNKKIKQIFTRDKNLSWKIV